MTDIYALVDVPETVLRSWGASSLPVWRQHVGYSAVRAPAEWEGIPPWTDRLLGDMEPLARRLAGKSGPEGLGGSDGSDGEVAGDLLWYAELADALAALYGHESARGPVATGYPWLEYDPQPSVEPLAPRLDSVTLVALSQVQAKLAGARVRLLRRFDAVNGHDADGYGSATPWLIAKAGLTRKAARSQVRQMRRLGERPALEAAMAGAVLTESQADEVAEWTRKLPGEIRGATDEIIVQAAAAGASVEDLRLIAAAAIERHRQRQPDDDEDESRFRDRGLQVGVTFGGAAVRC